MDSFLQTANYSQRLHLIPAVHPRKKGTVVDTSKHLQIAVNEFRTTRVDKLTITLILTHGTSFCKDLWQPLIEFWLRDGGPLPISTILALDAVNHGDSAVANEESLGQTTHWPDHSCDILQVLAHFGIDGPVIGLGHSFGGGTLAHASTLAPKRFAATIFVEPILFQMKEQTDEIARRALRRRDRWQDLDEVLVAFAGNKAMMEWTPDQRDRYAKSGTKIVMEGSQAYRTLKTPKVQEAATYLAAPHPDILKLLSNSQSKHFFVLGEESPVLNRECRKTLEEISAKQGASYVLKGAGHLIPMTHPRKLAEISESVILKVIRDVVGFRCNI